LGLFHPSGLPEKPIPGNTNPIRARIAAPGYLYL
jgi:hypothetical protein